LQENNFFCYIFNLEYRLFSTSPLLHLPPLLQELLSQSQCYKAANFPTSTITQREQLSTRWKQVERYLSSRSDTLVRALVVSAELKNLIGRFADDVTHAELKLLGGTQSKQVTHFFYSLCISWYMYSLYILYMYLLYILHLLYVYIPYVMYVLYMYLLYNVYTVCALTIYTVYTVYSVYTVCVLTVCTIDTLY